MMRIASVLLVAVLLSTCAIFSTFAKYASTSSGSDTARVAKWSIEVEDTEIGVAGPTTVKFDLFQTVNDTGNAANDEDVKDGTGDTHIIAPGTAGSFEITIENLSEVNAKYTITLEETNPSELPLQYSVDGTTWKDSIAELVMTELTNQSIWVTLITRLYTGDGYLKELPLVLMQVRLMLRIQNLAMQLPLQK